MAYKREAISGLISTLLPSLVKYLVISPGIGVPDILVAFNNE
jgi:hypothetical protein